MHDMDSAQDASSLGLHISSRYLPVKMEAEAGLPAFPCPLAGRRPVANNPFPSRGGSHCMAVMMRRVPVSCAASVEQACHTRLSTSETAPLSPTMSLKPKIRQQHEIKIIFYQGCNIDHPMILLYNASGKILT